MGEYSILSERHLLDQLIQTLEALPRVEVTGSALDSTLRARNKIAYDGHLQLHIGGRVLTLLLELKKTVFPRDTHQIIWQFSHLSSLANAHGEQDSIPLLVAESISSGTKELFKKEGIGYFDSGGSLFLPSHIMYVYIDKPPPKAAKRAVRSLFTGRRTQVLHALLMNPSRWNSVKELAEEANVSPATASEVLTALERFEWVSVRGQGPNKERQLQDPRALLDEWARHLTESSPASIRRFFVPKNGSTSMLSHIGHVFSNYHVDYGITHEAAAQCYAPYLSHVGQVRCRAVQNNSLEEALKALGARPVTEGANFSVIEVDSPDSLLFRKRHEDIWLVSPLQAYLDLVNSEGRAKEIADHLRNEMIKF